MRKVLIGVGIVVVLVGIGIGVVFYWTSGIVEVANAFFSAVQKQDWSSANALLSEEFRASTSLEQLQLFLQRSALAHYTKATWGERSITSGNRGELHGSVETENAAIIPIKMAFVKEKGSWKILSIQKAASGVVITEDTRPVPADEQLQSMVQTALQDLAVAVNQRDFTEFYEKIAKLWQAQTTKEALFNAFKVFSEQNIDLTVLQNYTAVFNEKPHVGDEGILLLKGYYPTPPPVAYFKLSYVYEHPEWKLVGINVEVK
jgi:hypothetical protein